MFNEQERYLLKKYCEEIIYSPRPIDAQPHKKENGKIWCEDWEIIEILKYMFNTKEAYWGDPPPNRLKNNPLWSKEGIEKKAEDFINLYKSPITIIDSFKTLRSQVASGI